jgi:hypothetical protein
MLFLHSAILSLFHQTDSCLFLAEAFTPSSYIITSQPEGTLQFCFWRRRNWPTASSSNYAFSHTGILFQFWLALSTLSTMLTWRYSISTSAFYYQLYLSFENIKLTILSTTNHTLAHHWRFWPLCYTYTMFIQLFCLVLWDLYIIHYTSNFNWHAFFTAYIVQLVVNTPVWFHQVLSLVLSS